MKKLLILTCALCVFTVSANAAAENKNIPMKKMPPNKEQMEKVRKAHEAAFEKKLGLTEVQKLKTRELRKEGFEKIKPVMDELKAKKQEAEKVRQSKLTVQAQEEKLTVIDKDIEKLEKQVKEIRKQNMKDFESILTKEQKKTLKNMKKEGRENFRKDHRHIDRPLPVPPPKPEEK